MAWLCNNCGFAHADGQGCPYIGLTPEERRLTMIEERQGKLDKRLKNIEDVFKAIDKIKR